MRRFLSTIEGRRWTLAVVIVTFMSLPLAVSAMVDGPSSVALVDSSASHSGAAASVGSAGLSTGIGGTGIGGVTSAGQGISEVSAKAPAEQVAPKKTVTGLEPGTLALMGFGLLALFLARRNAR